MKSKFTLLFILLTAVFANAQPGLENGSFDQWRGDEFISQRQNGTEKCCGPLLTVPVYWEILEQMMQMADNHFIFKETDSAHIYSGYYSARLYTDTTTMDSAGDVSADISLLVPGVVTTAGIVGYGGLELTGDLNQTIAYSTGYIFTDSPIALNFYMMFDHLVTDTARYAYAFTRWDSINMQEDTIAVNDVEIPDNANLPQNKWISFTDSIHYVLPGSPDTLHLIFFGGKNGDPGKIGNTTWLDAVSFAYASSARDTTAGDSSSTAVADLNANKAVTVYPNPASDILNVRVGPGMADCTIGIYSLTGDKVIQWPVSGEVSTFDITSLADGIYFYRLTDKISPRILQGKIAIVR